MVLPVLAQWILGIASFLAAVGVVYGFGRRLYRIDSAMPVLQQIAIQFNPDIDGRTLYQRIVAIEKEVQKIPSIEASVKHIEAQLASIKSDTKEVRRATNGISEK